MSSEHKAICKCGFEKTIYVGGLMGGYHKDSRFPFYCQHCGLVEANIAEFIGKKVAEPSSIKQDEVQNAPTCPHCGSAHIDQYGKPPASIQSTKTNVNASSLGVSCKQRRQPLSRLQRDDPRVSSCKHTFRLA